MFWNYTKTVSDLINLNQELNAKILKLSKELEKATMFNKVSKQCLAVKKILDYKYEMERNGKRPTELWLNHDDYSRIIGSHRFYLNGCDEIVTLFGLKVYMTQYNTRIR